ncbi:hypothetical protein C426_1553 [Lactococcus garvieae DCC43]|uniref:Uncharacterized protein n=1 Tax=Lactococcus garvieae DCC43 TaxID=1231377 RepID=K2PI77_9LACT|nr:hypothetical protein C426_1553 [Lactococcus garvieae DCC43]
MFSHNSQGDELLGYCIYAIMSKSVSERKIGFKEQWQIF